MRCLRCFFAFLTAAVCAVLLYCLYLKAPDPLTRALAPRNGSPWELGKLAFWSMLPAALVLHHLEPGSSRSGLCAAVLLSAVLAAALTPLGLPPRYPVPAVLCRRPDGLCPAAAPLTGRRAAVVRRPASVGHRLHPVQYPAPCRRPVHRSRRRVCHRADPLLSRKKEDAPRTSSFFSCLLPLRAWWPAHRTCCRRHSGSCRPPPHHARCRRTMSRTCPWYP